MWIARQRYLPFLVCTVTIKMYTYSTDHKQLNIILMRACKLHASARSSTHKHAYTGRKRKYYTRLYVCATCECRACEHYKRSTIRERTGLIDHCTRAPKPTHTHMVLVGTSASLVSATLTSRKHSHSTLTS